MLTPSYTIPTLPPPVVLETVPVLKRHVRRKGFRSHKTKVTQLTIARLTIAPKPSAI